MDVQFIMSTGCMKLRIASLRVDTPEIHSVQCFWSETAECYGDLLVESFKRKYVTIMVTDQLLLMKINNMLT